MLGKQEMEQVIENARCYADELCEKQEILNKGISTYSECQGVVSVTIILPPLQRAKKYI